VLWRSFNMHFSRISPPLLCLKAKERGSGGEVSLSRRHRGGFVADVLEGEGAKVALAGVRQNNDD